MVDSYSKLNIGTMLKLASLDEGLTPEDRQVSILAILSGCSEQEILDLPLQEYSRRVVASRFLDEDMPKRLPQKRYKVGEFDLVPAMDYRKVTTAQFYDFKMFSDLGTSKGGDLSSVMIPMLSCMMIPKGKKYCEGYEPEEVQEAIRDNLRADDAIALHAFFLACWARSLRRILRYSRKEARKIGGRERRREIVWEIKDLGKIWDRMMR